MQGKVSVSFPTKKYIKAYVIFKLGIDPVLDKFTPIGSKIYDLLQHKTDDKVGNYTVTTHTDSLRIYISKYTFRTRGAFLSKANIKNINNYLEYDLKERFRELMNSFLETDPSFEKNLKTVRKKLGIDIEAWSDDSMKKDYYRYRMKESLPLFYKKNNLTKCR